MSRLTHLPSAKVPPPDPPGWPSVSPYTEVGEVCEKRPELTLVKDPDVKIPTLWYRSCRKLKEGVCVCTLLETKRVCDVPASGEAWTRGNKVEAQTQRQRQSPMQLAFFLKVPGLLGRGIPRPRLGVFVGVLPRSFALETPVCELVE